MVFDQNFLVRQQSLQKERKTKNAKKLTRFLILAVLAFLVLFVIIKIPGFYQKISQPFKNIPNNITQNNNIDLKYRTNILLLSTVNENLTDVALASLSPTDKKLFLLKLDKAMRVESEKGNYTLADLYSRKTENQKTLDFLIAQISKELGYPVDGYFLVTEKNWISKQNLEKISADLYSFSFFLNLAKNKSYLDRNLYTNLSLKEFYQTTSAVKKLKPERINFIDLSKNLNQEGYLDEELFRSRFGVILEDPIIANEDLTISIVNSSGVEGTGLVLKKIITNLGGNVINLSSGQKQDNTTLVTTEKGSKTADRIKSILKTEIKDSKKKGNNSDIFITIGEDFAKLFKL